ncbi:uncharacterized protein LOC113647731 isoform X2 [Tachysurus fulvidraco]|uniref:uncharacterized protein LOC113647731 isoform X2 n=1 Tax=Tachysurus fulvidraco TaxID=1234273 RepID=UPI001FF044AD|nr:uncharacterized protein LOC113647731 isoform X2 [Tachysurus fulvidraco]
MFLNVMREQELTKSTEVFSPQHEEGADHHPCRTALTKNETPGTSSTLPSDVQSNDKSDNPVMFPGPLLSHKLQKDNLIRFIRWKCQECLLDQDEPEKSFFFWLIMKHCYNNNRKVMMAEISALLFRGYARLRRQGRARRLGSEEWCLPLALLLSSSDPEDEHREAIIKMGDDLASNRLIYAAHICYVAVQMELGSRQQFKLIGTESWPNDRSAMREVMERTEVYEYVLSLTSGFGQPYFQHFKYLYTRELAKAGLTGEVYNYCQSLAAVIFTLPHCFKTVYVERIIRLCESLLQNEEKKPKWLWKLYKLHREKTASADPFTEMLQVRARLSTDQKSKQELESRYIIGSPLGSGGFGSVLSGMSKVDGRLVAIKYVTKYNQYITIPGQTRKLFKEIALLEIVSKPPVCENVVELIEWFETPTSFILVLEQPIPSMDLLKFGKIYRSQLSEASCQMIMRQVARAAKHCCDRGVFHRDIKSDNIIINPDTLEVKLIDFGCGDLMKDDLYNSYSGTPVFCPPEWVLFSQYFAVPATVWSLGIVLYELVSGDLPFYCDEEIIDSFLPFVRGLSKECYNLLMWCLDLIPEDRPTLEEILSHDWLKEEIQFGDQAPTDGQDLDNFINTNLKKKSIHKR